jgi:hypothetical protein
MNHSLEDGVAEANEKNKKDGVKFMRHVEEFIFNK